MLRKVKQHGHDQAAILAGMLSITVPGSDSVTRICVIIMNSLQLEGTFQILVYMVAIKPSQGMQYYHMDTEV